MLKAVMIAKNNSYSIEKLAKIPFLEVFSTFLKMGWLEISHIRSTYSFMRAHSPRALRSDVLFR